MAETPRSNALIERIKQITEANRQKSQPQIEPSHVITDGVEIEEAMRDTISATSTPKVVLNAKQRVRAQMDAILKESKGLVSNIPVNSPYHSLQRRYRTMK